MADTWWRTREIANASILIAEQSSVIFKSIARLSSDMIEAYIKIDVSENDTSSEHQARTETINGLSAICHEASQLAELSYCAVQTITVLSEDAIDSIYVIADQQGAVIMDSIVATVNQLEAVILVLNRIKEISGRVLGDLGSIIPICIQLFGHSARVDSCLSATKILEQQVIAFGELLETAVQQYPFHDRGRTTDSIIID